MRKGVIRHGVGVPKEKTVSIYSSDNNEVIALFPNGAERVLNNEDIIAEDFFTYPVVWVSNSDGIENNNPSSYPTIEEKRKNTYSATNKAKKLSDAILQIYENFIDNSDFEDPSNVNKQYNTIILTSGTYVLDQAFTISKNLCIYSFGESEIYFQSTLTVATNYSLSIVNCKIKSYIDTAIILGDGAKLSLENCKTTGVSATRYLSRLNYGGTVNSFEICIRNCVFSTMQLFKEDNSFSVASNSYINIDGCNFQTDINIRFLLSNIKMRVMNSRTRIIRFGSNTGSGNVLYYQCNTSNSDLTQNQALQLFGCHFYIQDSTCSSNLLKVEDLVNSNVFTRYIMNCESTVSFGGNNIYKCHINNRAKPLKIIGHIQGNQWGGTDSGSYVVTLQRAELQYYQVDLQPNPSNVPSL